MKINVVHAIQIAVVVKAVREGQMDGDQVADALLGELIDNYVDGKQEERDVLKVLVKDIDGGLLGGLFNIALKKLAVKKPEEGKSGIGRFNGRCVICQSPLDKDDYCPNVDCANNIGNQEGH